MNRTCWRQVERECSVELKQDRAIKEDGEKIGVGEKLGQTQPAAAAAGNHDESQRHRDPMR